MNFNLNKSIFNNQTILITGGTGSFGKKFVDIVLKKFNPKKIIIYSRDELKQFEMSRKLLKYQKKLRFFIGDIRDLERLKFAMKGVDILIHAAALKQVPTAEYNPFEVVKTNVMGTNNVISAAIENNVKKSLALSTDKAAAPINLYGATKLTADKLFIAANNYNKNPFSVVRYGNVMMSRGSVINLFNEQKKKNSLSITDKRMTRFSITLEEGVNFVIFAISKMWGGEIFVPKIPSYNILDVAKAVCEKCRINFIGIRPGEKLHEEMITSTDSKNTVEYKNYYVILPVYQKLLRYNTNKFLKNFDKNGKICKEGFSYNSLNNSNYLKPIEIKKLIKENIVS